MLLSSMGNIPIISSTALVDDREKRDAIFDMELDRVLRATSAGSVSGLHFFRKSLIFPARFDAGLRKKCVFSGTGDA
jgi:hypothetical protein